MKTIDVSSEISFVARHYIKQILNGIEYLHSHQILHRDLKLHNLLLTKENDVVIHQTKIQSFKKNFLVENRRFWSRQTNV